MTWVKDSLLWVVHGHLPIFKISHKNSASVAQVLSHVAIKKLLQTKEQPACTLGLSWNTFWSSILILIHQCFQTLFKTYNFKFHACGSQCSKFLLVRNTKKESLAVCWQRFSYLCTYLNLLGLQNVKYLNSMMSLWVTSNLAHLIQNFFFLKKPSWGLNFFIFFLVK